MPESCDIFIAGGGPAGLAAAISLATAGLHVVVCEPKAYPIDKACGEGIMPTGVKELCKLGVDKYLSPDDYAPFRGIKYHTLKGASSASGLFSEGPGWGIERVRLSTAFRKRISDFSNVTLVQSKFGSYRKSTGSLLVETRSAGTFNTRLLIGTDGLHSGVRRAAGLEGAASSLRRWGIRRHYRIKPWSDFVEVYWGDGAEAYITPCGPELIEVAFLWNKVVFPQRRGGTALFEDMAAHFPAVFEKLLQAAPTDTIRSAGPLHQRVLSPVADGVLLAGDAAGYLDAITGEGISLALMQTAAIGNTVVPLLKSSTGVPTAHDLHPYLRQYKRDIRLYYSLTHLALFFSRHPAAAEKTIQTLSEYPDVFQTLLTMNMGRWPQIARLVEAGIRLSEGVLKS